MMYWGNGSGGWGYLMMAVTMVLFWGLLVAGVVVLVRSVSRRETAWPAAGPDPARVLAERFARGDIDEAEYRQRLRVLGG